jgi:pyruvate dehydrogenase E2 component (dihydrolipoamide acetyltransferase)
MGEIVMPRLSDTMEEGTILRWLKADGDTVQRGDELVEIETDKAAMTYESDQDGVLSRIAAEGDTLPVGEVIARVAADGDVSAAAGAAAEAGATVGEAGEAGAGANGDAAAATVESIVEIAGGGASSPAPAAAPTATGARVKASPLARRIAEDRGVDLHALAGSGPGGRIVKADVERAAAPTAPTAPTAPGAGGREAAAPAAAPVASVREDVATAKGQTTTQQLTKMQQTIARRMAESKATIPDFSLSIEVDMDACVKLREELKRLRPGGGGAQPAADSPTYNDMIVKASALALREHPRANGSYRDGRLLLHSRVNVGVAVAAEGALVVPTVFDADTKSLGEIARETRALAERVRAQSITPPELGGGTFTVSNLGMYGISSFTAIINPPQAAILAVGRLEPRVVAGDAARDRQAGETRDGQAALVVRPMLTLTLVCDHRILYGADAAQFLARVRELLQSPTALTL